MTTTVEPDAPPRGSRWVPASPETPSPQLEPVDWPSRANEAPAARPASRASVQLTAASSSRWAGPVRSVASVPGRVSTTGAAAANQQEQRAHRDGGQSGREIGSDERAGVR